MRNFFRYQLLAWALLLGAVPVGALATTVTANPGTCANVAGVGTQTWTNAANAKVSDAAYATVAVNDNQISNYLQCTNYGFTIPAGNVINGITVSVQRMVDNNGGSPQDYSVELVKAGAAQAANDKASATVYPTTLTTVSYGNATDLWTNTWSPSDIRASNFGVAFASQKNGANGGARTVSVDLISVTINYTADATLPSVSSIALASANPTAGAGSVSWTVTFSKSVKSVSAADFALVQAGGVSGASITSVTGSGTTWTVTASTGSGTGTLGLNLMDSDSILDLADNPLGGAGVGNGNFTGAVYTITGVPCNPPTNVPAGVTVSARCRPARGRGGLRERRGGAARRQDPAGEGGIAGRVAAVSGVTDGTQQGVR